ncbi:pre-peptidase C-terminal domain-containing protein [Lysinibacillus telephonicus]|uniref:pre-peptidase C-terminal domain-containing protein n=1 Tax=Lysinibacillus telephonicus TaxID=1714840 RepID=UPI0039796112
MKKWVFSLLMIVCFSLLSNEYQAKAAANTANDSFSAATPIKFENGTARVNGELTRLSNTDIYKFTLSNAGKVDISINRNVNTQYRVTLYNSAQRELERYESALSNDNEMKLLFSQGLDAGTYYVKVEPYKGVTDQVSYTLGLKYSQSNYYEKELNNDRNTANSISINKKYYGFADTSNDYYAFTIPSNGEVKIDLSQSSTTIFEVSLLSGAGIELETYDSSFSSNTNTIVHTGLPPGNYNLRIKSKEGDLANIPYEFIVNFKANNLFEIENNGSTSFANEISPGQSKQGVISSSADVDYYRLQVEKNTNFDLYITEPKNATFKVEISDKLFSVDEEMYTEYGNGSLSKISNITLPQGIYYIKIQPNQGVSRNVQYNLRIADTSSTDITSYKDYRPSEYWVESFTWGINNNILTGDKKSNRLNPNKNITEAQMLAMVLRYAFPNEAKDSTSGQWYNNYYKMASNKKIEVTNKPNSPLRRGDVAKILAKVYTGKNMTEQESVQWLYTHDITTGINPSKPKNYNNFNPDGKITRAQAITFMYRLSQKGINPQLK